METFLKDAAKRQDSFRPMPFWSWNDELEPVRLQEQIREMRKAGLGGFFMHARVGLKTPYMGEKWFTCVRACMDEAKKQGMAAWGYDENGYPSGIADGAVCRESEKYRSTWIELVPADSAAAAKGRRTLAHFLKNAQGWKRIPMDSDEAYTHVVILKNEMRAADPLNAEAVKRFLELTHERYKTELGERFGKDMPGFFTDEPQLKQYQLPWTDGLETMFAERYGYDLLDRIPALKDDADPGCEAVRHDYWMLLNHLYAESFAHQVGDWCRKNGCRFTGHIMAEDTILEQMGSNGGAMPFYEYMDIPGMDWLGRRIGTPLAPKQVSSVAAQMGAEQVLSETFALSGWDVSFEDLKWMAEWQYANGINLLCPHLESYSIRGIRKRDYPASLFVQEPWWDRFSRFTDYISALGATLGGAEELPRVLVIHPLHTAHILYSGVSTCEAVRELDRQIAATVAALQQQHIPYQFGDEVLMGKYATAENGRLKIGRMTYDAVLLPDMDNILSSTVSLLAEIKAAGGKVFAAGRIPSFVDGRPNDAVAQMQLPHCNKADFKAVLDENALFSCTENGVEADEILTNVKGKDGLHLYFAVNTSRNTPHTVVFTFGGEEQIALVDLPAFETVGCDARKTERGMTVTMTLRPGQSCLFINREAEKAAVPQTDDRLHLPEECRILRKSLNALTLDRCDCSVDGGAWQKDVPLIMLQKQLMDQKTDAPIRLRFRFDNRMTALPRELFLVSENIPEFSLQVNGQSVAADTEDWYLDPDFKRVNIAPFMKSGENEILLSGRFFQRKELYDYLYREKDLSSNFYAVDFEFESVTYDVELESIYLLGEFTVSSATPYTAGERRTFSTDGPFALTDDKTVLYGHNITTQGFPFFAGEMELEWTVDVHKEAGRRVALDIGKPVCPMAVLSVDGGEAKPLSWQPCLPDITDDLTEGKNRIRLTLFSGLRNLLGPHHYRFGESYYVGTTTFGNEPGWCEDVEGIREPLWTDRWCFVRCGIED